MKVHLLGRVWLPTLMLSVAPSLMAQPALEVETTTTLQPSGQLQNLGTNLGQNLIRNTAGAVLPPLRYVHDGTSPGLQIRSERPILCIARQSAGSNPIKQVVFDPNGYYPPIQLAEQALDRTSGETLMYGRNAFMRGSDVLRFGPAGFVGAASPGAAFYLAEVDAYCAVSPAVDVASAEPACTVQASDDAIMHGRFETLPQGRAELSVASRLLPPANTMVEYTYTVRAIDGPLYDLSLREQFPFYLHTATERPLFGRSYALEHNWHCRASAGGRCDWRGRELDGAGYIHLESGGLAQGACLRITTQRVRRQDGLNSTVAVSGRLHSGVFYTVAPNEQEPAKQEHRILRHSLP